MNKRARIIFGAGWLSAAAALALGCASAPDDSKQAKLLVESSANLSTDFRNGVEAVFERRCGSLDCHGTTARGMRIYSTNGLRLPNDQGNVPGVGQTTSDEINANYASIVGLQPENMNAFLAKNPRTADDAYQLIILTKPLQIERHKGGAALSKGEPAEQCIVTWLTGKADQVLCAKGSTQP